MDELKAFESRKRLDKFNEIADRKAVADQAYIHREEVIEGRSWTGKMLDNARRRSKESGLGFSLNTRDIVALMAEQAGRCAASGLPFSVSKFPAYRSRPFAPSIDRMDNARGYTRDNVRLVCIAANIAINEWGEDVFTRIAVGIVMKKLTLLS